MRILILVLCSRREPYPAIIEAVRDTWASEPTPGVEIDFYYGRPEGGSEPSEGRWFTHGDTIVCGCADAEFFQIGRKTALAFECALSTRRFDYLYRVNCSSYLDAAKLQAWLADRPRRRFYAGPVGAYPNTPESRAQHGDRAPIRFASGSGYILSRDLVETVVHEKQRFCAYERDGLVDDVALAKLLTEDHGVEAQETHAFVNYRSGRSTDHLPSADPIAFHYSFDRTRPQDMRAFHERMTADTTASTPIYSIVCTDAHPGAQWQCEFLEHTWRQVGQPGELLRLFAAEDDSPLPVHRHARVVRTRPSNTHPQSGDLYPPYNRLYSLQEWLERERPQGSVLLLDCDFVFRAPLPHVATPGAPLAQEWYAFHAGPPLLEAMEALAPGVTARIQPVTWPACIHTDDLVRLMPRWIQHTGELRTRIGGWESDMLAFVVASAELGIRYRLEALSAWTDWPDAFVEGAPILHYCRPVEAEDGTRLWYKWDYRPWEPLGVDPKKARLRYCGELVTMLETYAALRRGHPPPE